MTKINATMVTRLITGKIMPIRNRIVEIIEHTKFHIPIFVVLSTLIAVTLVSVMILYIGPWKRKYISFTKSEMDTKTTKTLKGLLDALSVQELL